ncbi:LAFE_0H16688g1_1 [Lachancea fermentati]|uniref:tRNA pseudouridine(55) synthase n=1 Tax=Lachancea fermentati TaxID=4955 RepID=A0A1G4ML07_LACFM|nr:LAFE_0H16688g1_1 [Lachancea fermentati]
MNGIFAIEKPSGISSSQFLLKVQHALMNSSVFSKEIQRATAERMQQYQKETGRKPSKRKLRKVSKIKMGHGGTLDPLASGVLVVGVGSGTKKLSEYLSGTVKVYESEALFGVSTTSGDVEGEILTMNSVKHLKMEELKSMEKKFVGKIKQTPPIFAALKMNGKPLHEYAREGIPLPRAIEPRQVEIYDLEIFPDSLTNQHGYELLRPSNDEDKDTVSALNRNSNLMTDKLYFSKEYCESQGWTSEEPPIDPPIVADESELKDIESRGKSYRAPLLHFKAKVSSGTYIRSLISDVGKAMRSSSYMVKLIRSQQQDWSLHKNNVFKLEDFTENDERIWTAVLAKVLEHGSSIDVRKELEKAHYELEIEQQKESKKMEEDFDAQKQNTNKEVSEEANVSSGLKRALEDDENDNVVQKL